jgi:8-oxo-dGTP diphosphatase
MTRFRVPTGAFVLVKEILRHLLKRPVVGVAVVARDDEGRYLLVRRADTGTWALPGGTLEWGEPIRRCIVRELREETNAEPTSEPELVGVYSDPARDPRFHAVTVLVACRVRSDAPGSENPLEIREAKFFAEGALPVEIAMGMNDMLDVVRRKAPPHLE